MISYDIIRPDGHRLDPLPASCLTRLIVGSGAGVACMQACPRTWSSVASNDAGSIEVYAKQPLSQDARI